MKRLLTAIYKKLHKAYGPQGWWPGDTPFEVAVGAVLTQNTNWSNVERAIANLKKAGALSAHAIHGMEHARLAELIRPAGYFNVKADRLKCFVEFLMAAYGGSMKRMSRVDAARLRPMLLGVKGVGQETADSILLYALDKPVFVIDAYTKRVLSRHGIMAHEEPYERFQELFMSALRPDLGMYNEYHALIVALGKQRCRPRNPLCEGCALEGLLNL